MAYLVVALPLLLGNIESLSSNYVATSTYDLGMLAWGFTQITVLSARLSELAGYTLRVGRLYDYLLKLGNEGVQADIYIVDENSSSIDDTDKSMSELPKSESQTFEYSQICEGFAKLDIQVSNVFPRIIVTSSDTETPKLNIEHLSVYDPTGNIILDGEY